MPDEPDGLEPHKANSIFARMSASFFGLRSITFRNHWGKGTNEAGPLFWREAGLLTKEAMLRLGWMGRNFRRRIRS
jgi:hypothetical protein